MVYEGHGNTRLPAADRPHVIRAGRRDTAQVRTAANWAGHDAPTAAIPVLGQRVQVEAGTSGLAHRPDIITGDGRDGIQVIIVDVVRAGHDSPGRAVPVHGEGLPTAVESTV